MLLRIPFVIACSLIVLVPLPVRAAKPPKVHTVVLGPVRRVPFIAADVAREAKEDEAGTLRVRGLYVDDKLREWTTGDQHDLTDRSFVTRRVLHVNDALPGEKAGRWVWQPGPWLLIDRISGRVTSLHLPEFDSSLSEVVWYRDYAAYCGIHTAAKGSGLSAEVWQIGARRAALQKVIAPWPQVERVRPVCAPAIWQREPMRVTLRAMGGEPLQFSVTGTSSLLVEDGEGGDDDN
ncbi:MAG: hypothetical protein ACRYF4_07830 [Janthinobacterium lividum]